LLLGYLDIWNYMLRSIFAVSVVAVITGWSWRVSASEDETAGSVGGSSFQYGARGLEFTRGETDLWLGVRFQTRFDTFDDDLVSVDDLLTEQDSELKLRRGRIKGGGQLLRDWLKVYSEYNFPSNTWLDYRATFRIGGWIDLRVGQWKSEFNRERIDSSGKQQLVERSISTYWFTIDRQRGLSTHARFGEGTRTDVSVWVEALSGKGLGGSFGDGDALYLARLQWNPAGEPLPFSQSDLARRKDPLPSIAIAHVFGDTPYTRFSSSGGGSLPGFSAGEYELSQWLIETALHYRGFGWQQELHFKEIRDEQTGAVQKLVGGYAQLGSFPHEWWSAVPRPLELVARVGLVDPDRSVGSDSQKEWTLGGNWFFNGHRNKLTLDYSWLNFEEPGRGAHKQRLRLQWELSL